MTGAAGLRRRIERLERSRAAISRRAFYVVAGSAEECRNPLAILKARGERISAGDPVRLILTGVPRPGPVSSFARGAA